jgi:hypothetical protein
MRDPATAGIGRAQYFGDALIGQAEAVDSKLLRPGYSRRENW